MVVMNSFPPPTEGLRHVEHNTQAFIGQTSHGAGTLYIAEERLAWCSAESGQGFSLEYPSISLHAISKDTTQFPHECLYCMTNIPLDEAGQEENNDSGDEDESFGEVRFVPVNSTSLEAMYAALCQCQVLHPDPDEELEEGIAGYGDEQEDDNGYFIDADEGELTEEGQATLARLEGTLNMPSQEEFVQMTQTNGQGHLHMETEDQFQDAEPEE